MRKEQHLRLMSALENGTGSRPLHATELTMNCQKLLGLTNCKVILKFFQNSRLSLNYRGQFIELLNLARKVPGELGMVCI